MTEVLLTSEWFRNFDTELFINWTKEMNMAETDWNFVTNHALSNPRFVFVNEEDAITFKLKFL